VLVTHGDSPFGFVEMLTAAHTISPSVSVVRGRIRSEDGRWSRPCRIAMGRRGEGGPTWPSMADAAASAVEAAAR